MGHFFTRLLHGFWTLILLPFAIILFVFEHLFGKDSLVDDYSGAMAEATKELSKDNKVIIFNHDKWRDKNLK
jgi:hypothetical protein